MAKDFVRKIVGVKSIQELRDWTNKIGDIIVKDGIHGYLRTEDEYKPITFPMIWDYGVDADKKTRSDYYVNAKGVHQLDTKETAQRKYDLTSTDINDERSIASTGVLSQWRIMQSQVNHIDKFKTGTTRQVTVSPNEVRNYIYVNNVNNNFSSRLTEIINESMYRKLIKSNMVYHQTEFKEQYENHIKGNGVTYDAELSSSDNNGLGDRVDIDLWCNRNNISITLDETQFVEKHYAGDKENNVLYDFGVSDENGKNLETGVEFTSKNNVANSTLRSLGKDLTITNDNSKITITGDNATVKSFIATLDDMLTITKRFNAVNSRIDNLQQQVNSLQSSINSLSSRISALER